MSAVAGIVTSRLPGSRCTPAEGTFLAICATLFVGSVAALILRYASMPALCLAPMPGGGARPMAWMRMPGQTWFEAAASFMGMWCLMTMAMMLPSLVPMLRRYRQCIARSTAVSVDGLTARVALGYFLVWVALGVLLYPAAAMLAAAAMWRPAWHRSFQLRTVWPCFSPAYCSSVPGGGAI
jgi:predicted metal-binding membrane protein